MKELPVLCLAIIAIVFIHATSKSENKNLPIKGSPEGKDNDLQMVVRRIPAIPAGFFSGSNVNSDFLKARTFALHPSISKISTENRNLTLLQPTNKADSKFSGNKNTYDPMYLFFQQRVNLTYGSAIAVK